jgi:cytochrome P450
MKNLFRAKDDDWKRLRSIMSPTFTSRKMKNMYDLIRECSREYEERFEFYANQGSEANMKDLHGNFTMVIVLR